MTARKVRMKMSGRTCADAFIFGALGTVAGMYLYSSMTPKKQRGIERAMRNTMEEMKGLVADMGKAVKDIG